MKNYNWVGSVSFLINHRRLMLNNLMKRLKRMSVMSFGERISLTMMAGRKKTMSFIRIRKFQDHHLKDSCKLKPLLNNTSKKILNHKLITKMMTSFLISKKNHQGEKLKSRHRLLTSTSSKNITKRNKHSLRTKDAEIMRLDRALNKIRHQHTICLHHNTSLNEWANSTPLLINMLPLMKLVKT